MNQLTETLNIAATEHRRDFVCNITAQFVDSLEKQGFTFEEVLDGLMNYAWVNTNSIDTVYFLMQASLSLKSRGE
ncbi:MAG: hypothetical protein ACYTX0_47710, partial [Nostoc sp.]